MNYEQVLEKIILIASNIFSKDGVIIEASTTAADVPSWNSLKHVMLVSHVEKEFGIKFDLLRMIEMKSVDDISRAALDILQES